MDSGYIHKMEFYSAIRRMNYWYNNMDECQMHYAKSGANIFYKGPDSKYFTLCGLSNGYISL